MVEPVIGLEVHVQLLTASKAFCGCSTKFGHPPNTSICPVCLGLPGVLPVLNRQVVDFTIRMGLAASSTIARRSVFARKNYFYPDLPNGYQISQYAEPICTGGTIEIESDDGRRKQIRLVRIHMEEDAGKSIHDARGETRIDINRCGVPLIEIVSEPDLRSPKEAYLFLSKIRQIVTYLGICDGNMEEGSLRCDANVSVRKTGEQAFGTKTELKNMNSFRNVERALEFEIARQIDLIENGEHVVPETLLWDEDRNEAHAMRGKEEAHDYRYFPEPDLVPVVIDEQWIDRVRKTLAEHPTRRRDRFIAEYGLPKYDADVLTSEKGYADYFEEVLTSYGRDRKDKAKVVSNWVMTDVLKVLAERHIGMAAFPVSPQLLAGLLLLIDQGTISGKIAKEVFADMLVSGLDPHIIVERKGLAQLSDETEIRKIVADVLERNAAQVDRYKSGNAKLLSFFVGEVMKATKGKANPAVVNDVLRRSLS